MNRVGGCERSRSLRQSWEQRTITDDGREPVGDDVTDLLWEQRTKHHNRNGDPGRSKGNALVERDDGDTGHSLRDERSCNLDGTVAVGIRLDDRHDLASWRE